MANLLSNIVYAIAITCAAAVALSNAQQYVAVNTSNQSMIELNSAADEQTTTNIISHDDDDDDATAAIDSLPMNEEQNKTENENNSIRQIPEGFNFNLDDLEDLPEKQQQAIIVSTAASTTSSTTTVVAPTKQHMEESSMEQSRKNQENKLLNSKNVYKVTGGNGGSKSKKPSNIDLFAMALSNDTMNATHLDTFNTIIQLYDQSQWNTREIENMVNVNCGRDMAAYLKALEKEETWALQGKFVNKNKSGIVCLKINFNAQLVTHLVVIEVNITLEMTFGLDLYYFVMK